MFAFRSVVSRASHAIHRFPPKSNFDKNLVRFLNEGLGMKVTAPQLQKEVDEHLAACKAAAKAPEGAKVLPNGRISLKNNYYGRGYLDQNRSPVTGQTMHEIHESIRRVAEPLEGFQISGPHFIAQVMDHKASMHRFYWVVFLGFAAGFAWAILYRINDNAMFAEWDATYKEHLAIHQKYHALRLAKMEDEGISFDTKPVNNSESILVPV